jgi:hypothetical protein
MAHIKIKGRWYLEESLTDTDRIRLGVMKPKDDFDEKEILKELKETPEEVKKSLVKKRKGKGKNIMAGKVVIGKPTLGEIIKGD